ncbi:3-dehydroquinate synthase [Stieleria bergensis]|uniref:3-dehydroquinate synthase n=1 Tax=Stieleria bergensis TaxID=2528025 RepID=A0A517SRG5_9BACT|nr:3-dehydroquinate synthase [Planctomycetes bacterium SV_7m_r]
MLHSNDRSSGHSEVTVDESHLTDRPRKPADSVSFDADVSFSVPFVHRLRRTDNVADQDFHVLVELLHGGHDLPRVLLLAERPVAEASEFVPQLAQRLTEHPGVNLVRELYVTAGGEAVKNDSQCVESILQLINEHHLDRRSYVVAVGGGAMLDAVGYATAIAHRGVRLIRIPTTTLAQGDSGVGVKNAINYFNKKNWVGTFSVPWAVINDSAVLQSLSDRDFCSGFSESVKVSLLKSVQEFDWLCRNAERIQRRDQEKVDRAIAVSCQLHLDHITKGGDPFEMLEARPLDFGHWSAHKLEPLTNYQVRHGEAVAIGVAIDCFYSHLKLGLPLEDVHRVCDCLKRLGIPLWHPDLEPMERLLAGLEEFRQHLGGRLTITLLRQIGQSCDVHEIDRETMHEALKMLQQWNAASA